MKGKATPTVPSTNTVYVPVKLTFFISHHDPVSWPKFFVDGHHQECQSYKRISMYPGHRNETDICSLSRTLYNLWIGRNFYSLGLWIGIFFCVNGSHQMLAEFSVPSWSRVEFTLEGMSWRQNRGQRLNKQHMIVLLWTQMISFDSYLFFLIKT